MGRNLGPLNIKDSYEGLVQISGSQLTNGSGSLITDLTVTASDATSAVSSSYAVSSSHAVNSDTSISSSYALTASYAESSSADDLTLQQVTTNGNTTSNPLNVTSTAAKSIITQGGIEISSSTFPTLEIQSLDATADPTLLFQSGSTYTGYVAGTSTHLELGDFNSAKVKISGSSLEVDLALTASGINYPTTDGTVGQAVVTDGSGNLSFSTVTTPTPNLQQVLDEGSIATGSIELYDVAFNESLLLDFNTNGGSVLSGRGNSVLNLGVNQAGQTDLITLGSNGAIGFYGTTSTTFGNKYSFFQDKAYFSGSLDINTALTASGLNYPTSDGTTGQVIETDGAGNLSFVTAGGGGGAAFPFSGSAVITGSLLVSGSTTSDTVVLQTAKLNGGSQTQITELSSYGAGTIGASVVNGAIIASGDSSIANSAAYNGFIAGGDSHNINSGNNTGIVGGFNNTINSDKVFIGGGEGNTCNSNASAMIGGSSNVLTGNSYKTMIGGIGSTLTNGNYSGMFQCRSSNYNVTEMNIILGDQQSTVNASPVWFGNAFINNYLIDDNNNGYGSARRNLIANNESMQIDHMQLSTIVSNYKGRIGSDHRSIAMGNIADDSNWFYLSGSAGYSLGDNGNQNAIINTYSSSIQESQKTLLFGTDQVIVSGLTGSVVLPNSGPRTVTNDYTLYAENIDITGSLTDSDGNVGTTGQALTSNGVDKVQWATVGGGGSPLVLNWSGSSPAETDYKIYVNDYGSMTPTGATGSFQALSFYEKQNIAIGLGALSGSGFVPGTAEGNIVMGTKAGTSITTGKGNLILGPTNGDGNETGTALTTGTNNILIGKGVGKLSFSTGQNNILMGTDTNIVSFNNSGCVHIGEASNRDGGGGANAVRIGKWSGYSSNGAQSINIGHRAGFKDGGDNNIYIGQDVQGQTATTNTNDNQIALGSNTNAADNLIYGNHGADTTPGDRFLAITGVFNLPRQTTDPTGAGVTGGSLYFNTSTNKPRCYNGSIWTDLF